jgi:hypothetical protein
VGAAGNQVDDAALIGREPLDLAPAIAVIAVCRLGEGTGQFPFLGFVAPLHGGVADDVVRLTVGADGGGARGRRGPAAEAFRGFLVLMLVRVERIEKRRVCHVIPIALHETGAIRPTNLVSVEPNAELIDVSATEQPPRCELC